MITRGPQNNYTTWKSIENCIAVFISLMKLWKWLCSCYKQAEVCFQSNKNVNIFCRDQIYLKTAIW